MYRPADDHVVIKGDEECNKNGTETDSWRGAFLHGCWCRQIEEKVGQENSNGIKLRIKWKYRILMVLNWGESGSIEF